jgi:hypothetical protein
MKLKVRATQLGVGAAHRAANGAELVTRPVDGM